MKALSEDINRFWDACADVSGAVVPGGHLDIDDLDDCINALDRALTTIRTLDLEVLDASDEQAYRALRLSDARGGAVRGVTGPRNNAVHGVEVVNPDISNALGPIPGTVGRFAVLPKWKATDAVPATMFQNGNGSPNAKYEAAYEAALAGKPILDTLLDAFAFFEACDGRLVTRDGDGQLAGFPLRPLPIANRYRRLHPDWPSEEEWNLDERDRITNIPPGGLRRRVEGTASTADATLLCGVTEINAIYSEVFVEPIEQVTKDIDLGYTYVVNVDGALSPITIGHDGLLLGAEPLDISGMPAADPTKPWLSWWQICLDDANYYRIRRQQPIVPGGDIAPEGWGG